MAFRCRACGSATGATGLDKIQCLECGTVNPITAPPDRGRVDNPDGAAKYHGDDGVTYG